VQSERVPGLPELHLELSGEGPLVVLVHGFGGSARNWRPQGRSLGGSVTIAAFDVRGHARSDAPPGAADYRPECFVADLERVLDHLGAARAVVGGLSMGASIALRFAEARPERVAALLLASFPPGAGEGRQEGWARDFADAIEREGLEAAGERYAWGPDSGFGEAAAKLVRQGFLEHSPVGLAHTLRSLLARQASVAEMDLSRLQVPALVVAGSQDRVSLRVCEALAHALPRGQLEIIEGAGHVANLEARAAFDAALGAFLSGL